MQFNFTNYLKTNDLDISREAIDLCKEAIGIMQESKDSMHNTGHITRMLKEYAELRKRKLLPKDTNDEVIVLAICCHDIWKASQKPPRNFFVAFYQQVLDGIGSARLFRQHTKSTILDDQIIEDTAYAIRKHAQFQFLPLTTSEAKILWDLDKLEKWNSVRAKSAAKTFFVFRSKFTRKILGFYLWFDNENSVYYPWAKKELEKRIPKFLKKLDNFN